MVTVKYKIVHNATKDDTGKLYNAKRNALKMIQYLNNATPGRPYRIHVVTVQREDKS